MILRLRQSMTPWNAQLPAQMVFAVECGGQTWEVMAWDAGGTITYTFGQEVGLACGVESPIKLESLPGRSVQVPMPFAASLCLSIALCAVAVCRLNGGSRARTQTCTPAGGIAGSTATGAGSAWAG